jgi:rhodanese-related sulfurtransferase
MKTLEPRTTTLIMAGVALLLLVASCARATSYARVASDARAPAAAPLPQDLASLPKNGDGYTDITAQQLSEVLADENRDLTLVNVHIPYEGEIPQTDLFIPFNEITDHLDELPDKDAPIILYCAGGPMSTSAAKALVPLGYSNLMELDGGMWAWDRAGYERLNR